MKTALLAPICLLLVVLTSKTSAFYDDTNYCPSADSISPCQCNSYPTSRGNNIHLDCGWTHLGDSKFSEVLQLIWENNGWNKLGSIVAFSCSLTKIPDEITRFRSLGKIELYNNRITSIESGAFDFSSAPYSVEIDLNVNAITSIETGAFNFDASTKIIDINFRSNEIATVSPDSFQGDGGYRSINFMSNRLSQIEEAVFKPLLEKRVYIDLSSNGFLSNSGYCWDNRYYWDATCQIPWLFRDNRHLLKYVDEYFCVGKLMELKLTDFDIHCNSSDNDGNIDNSN